ncbi:MAG TPA: hypothetical protein VFI37_01230 [Gaiellaceae bacterium]|nr:hypothetical protein [Gaiellaceae bacterium]
MIDWLRLAFATVVVLWPGRAVARALGQRTASAALAWGLAAIGAALAITFAVHGSILLTFGIEMGIGALALCRKPWRQLQEPREGALVALVGLAFGGALWFVSGPVGGDGLFHLARVRKLDAFGDLSLRTVDEFRDGGLHPGYAFPLWHGFLALLARVGGLDPAVVVRHAPSLLVVLAFPIAWEAGRAVFGGAWGGVAVLVAQVALYGLAAGHGGGYTVMTNPGTAVRQLLAPAGIALFFGATARRDRGAWATLAALFLVSTLIHPAFTLFVLIPLGGFVVVRLAVARTEWRESLAALAFAAVPFGAVLLWLRPVVAETAAHTPGPEEQARALEQYADQLHVVADGSYRLGADVLSRSGAVAVAALLAVPVAALAARRRWGAFVLGGSLAILALMLVPWLFVHFSDVVTLSQSRRSAGFLPFAFAFAGGMWALARLGGVLALPAALGLGIAFQLLWPGDFGGRTITGGGPAWATWVAAIGGAAALAAALVVRPRLEERRTLFAGLAAVLFVIPVAVHGFREWTPPKRLGAGKLTPGLLEAVRKRVPEGAVVYSNPSTSYELAAYAPVYIAVAPPGHVANTAANRPYDRLALWVRYHASGDLAIPRRAGAGWLVVDTARGPAVQGLRPVYRDRRYALYRL